MGSESSYKRLQKKYEEEVELLEYRLRIISCYPDSLEAQSLIGYYKSIDTLSTMKRMSNEESNKY